MKAVQYGEFNGPIRVVEIDTPSPGQGEVVIEVRATGVCRSDWHGWHGHDPDITSMPHVPGHEYAGVVSAVGEGVRRLSVGDRVAVPFVLGCGRCSVCSAGNAQVCPNQQQPGFTGWGSFAEYVVTPYADNNLIRLPPHVDMETAASLGCRFTTAYRAVVQQGRVAPDEWVVIFGCGGVGLSGLLCAKASAAKVIAVDTSEAALALADDLGADHTLGMSADVGIAIADLTGDGPHLTLDAIGSSEVIAASLASLRPRGRHVQVGLLVGDETPARLSIDRVISKELEILGSHGASQEVFAAVFEMIDAGKLDPAAMVTTRIGLDDIPSAMEGFGDHGPGTAVAVL